MIERLKTNRILDNDEFIGILETDRYDADLYAEADRIRREYYGTDVYIRGLIEFTNHCKNNCYYCGIRAGNENVLRYRLDKETVLEMLADLEGFTVYPRNSRYILELREKINQRIKVLTVR